MGMDAYIRAAHSKKDFESDVYWNDMRRAEDEGNAEETKWSRCGELWYARKFWDLHKFIQDKILHGEYDCGEYVELKKKDIAMIIIFCCFNRDYWDGFSTVPDLCEIYNHWSDLKQHGLKVFYECDW